MSAIAMGPQFRTAPTLGRPRKGVHGLTLTSRGRAVVLVLAALIGALVVMLGGQALAESPASPQAVVEHQVASGETLWGIAASSVAEGDSVGKAVTELVRLNNLPSSEVMAGQTILVPENG